MSCDHVSNSFRKLRLADQTRRATAENRKQDLHRFAVLLAEAKVDHQILQTAMLHVSQAEASLEEEDAIAAKNAA